MRYRFTCNYESTVGSWQAGDEADFDADLAAWLLRDVRGCIVPVDAPASPRSDERAMDAPKHDRQLKRAPRTR